MNLDPRKLAEVDRLIHEPARLMIVTILSAVESADFLYLQHHENWLASLHNGASSNNNFLQIASVIHL